MHLPTPGTTTQAAIRVARASGAVSAHALPLYTPRGGCAVDAKRGDGTRSAARAAARPPRMRNERRRTVPGRGGAITTCAAKSRPSHSAARGTRDILARPCFYPSTETPHCRFFLFFFVSQKVFVENRTGWPGGQLFFLAKFSCLPKEGSRRRVVPSPMARLRPGAAAAGVALGAAAVALLCYVTAGPRATGGGDVDLLAAARRQGAKAYPTSVREPGEGRARARIHSRCAPPPVALAAPPSPSPPLSLCPSSPTPPPSPVS